MYSKGATIWMCLLVSFGSGDGVDDFQPTNYDISRNNKLGGGYNQYPNYGNYPSNQGPAHYPSGPGNYPNQYPGGNYPGGNYPVNSGVAGPPGAHPGCPLCDSSVYSYCYHKQAHDSCCCENPAYIPYNCRKTDCKFLYANSCDEYNLISSCCCIDLQKNAVAAPVVPVVG